MSVFRASWLAKCASRFAFLSDCRSQRERRPALLPSRRVNSKHEFCAHARALSHVHAPVSGCLGRTLGDGRKKEKKKKRNLSQSDVDLVIMPVTEARHMLVERYRAISLRDSLIICFLFSFVVPKSLRGNLLRRAKEAKKLFARRFTTRREYQPTMMGLTLPLRTGADGFSEAELRCFLFLEGGGWLHEPVSLRIL